MEKSMKHLEDLSEIRNIMERSTKFLSLSGWSGFFAGVFGLFGAIAAWLYLDKGSVKYDEYFEFVQGSKAVSPIVFFILDGSITLVLALASAFLFSYKKTIKTGEKLWSPVVKRLIFQLAVPLLAGGAMALILIYHNQPAFVASITLIFYGLALVNAGKYTNSEIIVLGIFEIVLGLAAAFWLYYGLYFWALGFGVFHMIYGVVLYYKYDRKEGI